MKKRTKQSLSLIFALLPFLLFGVLSFSPVYGGPETLGPSPVDQIRSVDTVSRPAEFVDETAEDDAEPVVVTTDERALPIVVGQVASSAKEAAPLRFENGFNAFNAQYQNEWRASFSKTTGKVKVLYGASSKQYEDGPESVARGFLGDSHMIFGLKQDLSDLKTQRVDRTPERDHVRFQQTYNGIPIVGALVLVHSNPQGQVTMVQNDYIQGIQVANAQVIPVETAKNITRNDLQTSLGKGAILSDAKVEKVIAPHKEKYYYVWKIAIPTQNPWGYWVYHVDAETGEILYKGNEIRSLKNGQGRAYTSNANWHLGKISNVSLKKMFANGDGYGHSGGWLWGLHADIWDWYGYNPYASDYKFLYDPIYQKDYFDATHAYYQMDTVWDWWNKNVISKYGPVFPDYFYSNPPAATIVNVVGLCNAYYSPPNYFVFGDENSCAPGSEDLVIDIGVVRHEFTHAMMDWCGFDTQFGGPTDYYGRAMGEGNSDWFAFLNNPKNPLIGDVAWDWSAAGYLRDLDNTKMYPYDVGCSGGMPEEHCTGEIWGGYLYDLYRVLKGSSLKYVYESFYYFSPYGGHMSSYPDFADAIYAQIYAEVDLTDKWTSSAKAWGSMASRGIIRWLLPVYSHPTNYFYTGGAGTDTRDGSLFVPFPPIKSINTQGNFLISGDAHEYLIDTTLQVGLKKLTATVTAPSGGAVNPSIYLYNSSGGLLWKVESTTSTKAVLTYPNLPPGHYVILVTGNSTAPARGYYNFKLDLK